MLVEPKLNSIELLISKGLINLNISYDEYVLIENVLKESEYSKDEIENRDLSKSKKQVEY